LQGECIYAGSMNGKTCDDHDPITTNDVCVYGECKGTPAINPKNDKSSSSLSGSTTIVIVIAAALVVIVIIIAIMVVVYKSRRSNAIEDRSRNPSMGMPFRLIELTDLLIYLFSIFLFIDLFNYYFYL
jgi:heme/copper-type cytochrome/quinol oxidase subunit 2